jgi:cell division transport system ATP-binding protein
MEERSVVGIYHLTKKYGDFFALRDVSLQVAKGQFIFLVGPSGAGKSTLLRLIYMDEVPTDGQVVVGPFVSTKMNRKKIPFLRRRIGVVFQDFKLLEDRNVFENIAVAMHVVGEKSYTIKKHVMHILSQVGLYHKRNDYPETLSGGEQQRVAIARAIVNSPSVLLADEPTGNLDPDVTEEILKLLFRINSSGTAVLMATHNLALVESFGQRILYLDKGMLLEDRITGLSGNLNERLEDYRKSREQFSKLEEPGEAE